MRLQIQILEIDHLDEYRNEDLPNGNRIQGSIERDQTDVPVA
jgi:hypothetical protein